MLNVRDAAIVAITSASLSLLAMSVAQAHGGEKSRSIGQPITPPSMPPRSIVRRRRRTRHSTTSLPRRKEARIIAAGASAKRQLRSAKP